MSWDQSVSSKFEDLIGYINSRLFIMFLTQSLKVQLREKNMTSPNLKIVIPISDKIPVNEYMESSKIIQTG